MAKEKILSGTYAITGMTCVVCAGKVESSLNSHDGVLRASVNLSDSSVLLEYDGNIVSLNSLRKLVQKLGYDMLIEEKELSMQEEIREASYRKMKELTILSGLFSVHIVLLSMVFTDVPHANYIMFGLATPVLFVFGRNFFINAFKQLRVGQVSMDTLVSLSTSIAYLFSMINTFFPEYLISKGLEAHVYFEAAAVIIFFISIGKVLEERAKGKTSSAIKNLMGLQPKTVVRVGKDGKEEIVDINLVELNDIILVKPGEKIAVDGKLVSGESFVDESMISGEPIAVHKRMGGEVFAGTINQKGSFKFKALKVGKDTVLSQIIQMVRKAQGTKAPVQRLVDKIASIFVPTVISLAVLSFAIWMIFGGPDALTHALISMVTVLIIACPCALGLATPTAIMVGIGKGAEKGILIKDAESLELAHKIDTIVLDKTGTITEGKPVVSEEYWCVEGDKQKYRNIIYTLESMSEHPLADAMVSFVDDDEVENVLSSKFESITGKGVKASVGGKDYYIGSLPLILDLNLEQCNECSGTTNEWEMSGKSIVFFASSDNLLATFAIEDKIKDSSREAITSLQKMGIKVCMLTGDNVRTARYVSEELNIDEYFGELMPSRKAFLVEKMQEEGKCVAMVGDGINDSQALAQADVSIAMGSGTDIAMDVAKMTIISSDLRKLVDAISLSKSTVRTIHQNLFWAFIYNIIGIPIAAGLLYPFNGFLLNPMIAGATMALSSVSVVSNSLRLKFK